jgi:hypothetical protein
MYVFTNAFSLIALALLKQSASYVCSVYSVVMHLLGYSCTQ